VGLLVVQSTAIAMPQVIQGSKVTATYTLTQVIHTQSQSPTRAVELLTKTASPLPQSTDGAGLLKRFFSSG
jgi:hypothetical protein